MVNVLEKSLKGLTFVKGITTFALGRLFPNMTYREAMLHFPTRTIDRRNSLLRDGEVATVAGKVLRVAAGFRRSPTKVILECEGGELDLTFFTFPPYLKSLLSVGAEVAVSGEAKLFGKRLTMSHPDYILPAREIEKLRILEPVYPLTDGLPNRTMRRVAGAVLSELPRTDLFELARRIHARPDDKEAREKLAYAEALAHQLSLALARDSAKKTAAAAIAPAGKFAAAARGVLPFKLTNAQEKTLGEIMADLAATSRMTRLLQGDVGSGKTLVAELALLACAEAGFQGALMAPTEILAQQHYEGFSALMKAAKIPAGIVLLTSRDKGAARRLKLEAIASGEAKIAVGTHSLIEDEAEFKNLGLAVIDEQHKFGVRQRQRLYEKGPANLLMMTATPIPRSLAMTAFGDLEVSVIDELPPGRIPQKTSVRSIKQLDETISELCAKIESGEIKKAYWVCPLVDESEKLGLAAVNARAEDLRRAFGSAFGLLHGRMKPEEKERVIGSFADPDGEVRVLLATSVIEVGVNVPEATVMVIEEAQRFGLASLHQLRGRIGRGGESSQCILVHNGKLSETARARLGIMAETTDGFRIAEEDLRLRGEGDIAGVMQSGQMEFRLANLGEDLPLFERARSEAEAIVARGLSAADRELLAVFGY